MEYMYNEKLTDFWAELLIEILDFEIDFSLVFKICRLIVHVKIKFCTTVCASNVGSYRIGNLQNLDEPLWSFGDLLPRLYHLS